MYTYIISLVHAVCKRPSCAAFIKTKLPNWNSQEDPDKIGTVRKILTKLEQWILDLRNTVNVGSLWCGNFNPDTKAKSVEIEKIQTF
jgi:hypothetical protein